MIKETVGIAGISALLLPAVGISFVACGFPGLLVIGAGLLITDTVVKGIQDRNGADKEPVGGDGAGQDLYSSGTSDLH
ncbi:MAG: hypothetical protein HGB00_06985 [Chlorobiaceae bacterium]|nr:hypothetical protein [Chlorobiaceae bacterium]